MRLDKLEIAHQIVRVAFAFFILSIAVILFSSFAGHHQQRTGVLIRALSLRNLALTPTGRPLRNPEMLNPAVDLRFSPFLYQSAPDPAELLLKLQEPEARKAVQ